ncbi:MAG: hypothetical protein GY811_18565 [Myxococcales bacterium]|nr:hypothetical protein [Myxococcales bacterium]
MKPVVAQAAVDGCPETSASESQTGTTLEAFADATNGGVIYIYDDSVAALKVRKEGGLFQSTSFSLPTKALAVCAADFDGDGWQDIVGGSWAGDDPVVYKNRTYENQVAPNLPDWDDPSYVTTPKFSADFGYIEQGGQSTVDDGGGGGEGMQILGWRNSAVAMRRLSPKFRNPQRGEGGFTMMELLIVMGVSLFGLAGLMSVYTTASRANNSAGHSAEAIDVCERTMEEFRSMSITDLESESSYGAITTVGWGPVKHHKGDATGRNGVIFGRDVTAIETAVSSGLVRIQVDVSWLDNGTDPDTPPQGSTVHNVSLAMIRTRVEAL